MAVRKEKSEDVKIEEALKQDDAEVKQEDAKVKQEDAKVKQEDAKVKQEDAKVKQKDAKVKQKDAKVKQKDAKVKQKDAKEQTDDKSSVTIIFNQKTFIVPKDVQVCFLTDSICLDIEHYFPKAQCQVHLGLTLAKVGLEHIKHFEKLQKDTIVVLHIGAFDIINGASSLDIAQRVKTLISEMLKLNSHILCFAVSSILPQVEDQSSDKTIKKCNKKIEQWCLQKKRVLFLNSFKLFLRGEQIIERLYLPGGVHLNQKGRHKLFSRFSRFLAHFGRFK